MFSDKGVFLIFVIFLARCHVADGVISCTVSIGQCAFSLTGFSSEETRADDALVCRESRKIVVCLDNLKKDCGFLARLAFSKAHQNAQDIYERHDCASGGKANAATAILTLLPVVAMVMNLH